MDNPLVDTPNSEILKFLSRNTNVIQNTFVRAHRLNYLDYMNADYCEDHKALK